MKTIKEELYFEVPHGADGRQGFGGRDITSKFPFQDEEECYHLGLTGRIEKLAKQRLKPATVGEVVSILYDALIADPEDPTSQRLQQYVDKKIKIHETISIFGNTGLLYTHKGLFIQDNPKATIRENEEDGKIGVPDMEEKELRKRLSDNDPSVRYIRNWFLEPYREGHDKNPAIKVQYREQTPLELERNLFVLELLGLNETIKLAELSKRFGSKPDINIPGVDERWENVKWGRSRHEMPVSYFVTLEIGNNDLSINCFPYYYNYSDNLVIGVLPDEIALGIKEYEHLYRSDIWKMRVHEGSFLPYVIEGSHIVKKRIK